MELHWHVAFLDSLYTVIASSASMSWQGLHPAMEVVTANDHTGVTLTKEAMAAVGARTDHLPH